MRTLSRNTYRAAVAALLIGAAQADTITTTSSIVNSAQFGMTLPSASLPSGQDEIHSSDGTSCRSAVGGNGAYMDMGLIGAPSSSDSTNATAAAYGRVVIPLGDTAKRLDCSQLYALEIERLKMEIQLAKMGAGAGATPEFKKGAWMDEGWNDAPPKGAPPAKSAVVTNALPGKASAQGAVLTAVATPPSPTVVNEIGSPTSKKKPLIASDPQVTGSLTPALAVPASLKLTAPYLTANSNALY